ncbi:hypothetical protein [Psychroserpens sp. SPM9]|uniref:hypothetical protein n=1 Tax=Psychroserpens sp. SPM9 TaxID=2975598 RepID=UPI0021A44568|nr:hypothetical protein [Psychroserpens sp. SPM9]MDG5492223.1 hypothetical protein [Psychroserpens sp. SPM9]
MKNKHLKYHLLPLIYIGSVLLNEFYPNIITIGIWFISFLLCVIALIRFIKKKRILKSNTLLIILLLIPMFDVSLGITNSIRTKIKGKIVLSIIDDGFATTKSLTIRAKNGKLNGEFSNSAAGFGGFEKAQIEVLNDSAFLFKLSTRDYSEHLTLDKQTQRFYTKKKNMSYRILLNELLK